MAREPLRYNVPIVQEGGEPTEQFQRQWQQLNAAVVTIPLTLADYADDTAAAAGGIAVGSLYRTGSVIKVRVV